MTTLTQDSDRLRQIARMYMEGDLSKSDYRQQRRAVIQHWSGEPVSTEQAYPSEAQHHQGTDTDQMPAMTPQVDDAMMDSEERESATLLQASASRGGVQEQSNWLWLVPLVLGLVGLAGLGSMILWAINQ